MIGGDMIVNTQPNTPKLINPGKTINYIYYS